MNRLTSFCLAMGVLFMIASCSTEAPVPQSASITSPSGVNTLDFFLREDGSPAYTLSHRGQMVIDTSGFGFEFKDMPVMKTDFEVTGVQKDSLDETWGMPWGEQLEVDNHYNELTVDLTEANENARSLSLRFRVYDDGIGFRYEFPEMEGVKEVIITDEHTEFQLTADHTAWWIPGDWDIYEHLYNTTKVSEINAIAKRDHPNLAATHIPENSVNTPVTMRAEGEQKYYLSFHEAALVDYAGMTLRVDTTNLKLSSGLVGSDRLGYKVKRSLPFHTPWRTIQVADEAKDLIASQLILNLNEPNKIGDVSWFTPMKYTGIWWEMHLGKSSWDFANTQRGGETLTLEDAKGTHGATTENTKAFIDFSAENNIGGVLVEGWNTGWEHWIGFEDREGVFDFITPYPDYDLEEVVRYGKEKGVEIIMHHETSAAPRTYEQQMDTAYALMQHHGIHSVKSGYVGKLIPKGEYHHGQWMVNHFNNAVIKAAEYEIAVNAHEPIKATGLRRTYPNMISREGLRGQEFNAWSIEKGNPPEHLPIVAFTRMLSGPIDYTPGIFNIKLDPWKPESQVNTTLAQQLALYVVIYSPIQMAADLIENYEGNPAFQFIRDVGVDWQRTEVINGEPGDFVTIARQERETGDWFVGSITDEESRGMNIALDFLEPGISYEAVIYKDAPDAHWDLNPEAIDISTREVTHETVLQLKLAPGGGAAISIKKAE
ncbi:glycoside hydrolase family 97 protein [Robertkochia marina]|uniref:Glycoside hydrolase family 97 protein n=1 Tax=Robertkochia marina TaxID=1227945 RepID=A0A4S3M275_9FLAO|nr:glycoside hydrolase family 97 protein [Robertkochia marina]THD69222.1 glycoside hydrolase family 97 protein [Robertkochia marina]TRZ47519.1 glycoside hydrolase family 97 protein [Robertkochia marina]